MARWYWLFRQTQARYPTVESAVRTQIIDAAEANGITVDADTLTGYQANRLFDMKYDWEIEPVSDAYIVLEKQYVAVVWYILFGIALVAFGVAVTDAITSFNLVLGDLFFVFVLIVLFGLLIRAFFYQSPMDETIAASEDFRTHPAAGIVLLLAVPLLLVTLLFVFLTLTILPDFWAVTVLSMILLGWMVLIFRRQTSLRRFQPGQIPHIYELVSAYLSYIFFGILPASALIALQPKLLPTPSVAPFALGLLVGVEIVILGVTIRSLSRERTVTYYRLRKGEETVQRPVYRPLILLLLGGAAYSLVYMFVDIVHQYVSLLTLTTPLVSVAVILAVLPLLYIPVGILLQTATFLSEIRRIFDISDAMTVETPVEIEPQVRVLRTDRYTAGSYSLGVNDYIFVSEALVDDLEPEELGAVLAHEEGHIHHRDALLSFLIPFAALLMLTGKNVVYTVLDFRTREFRADAYAAEKMGSEPLKQALRTMASKADEGKEAQIRGSAPTFISFSRLGNPGLLDRYFGTFFGNFALTEAHPGFEERIEQIDS